jgi:hypothetical protein
VFGVGCVGSILDEAVFDSWVREVFDHPVTDPPWYREPFAGEPLPAASICVGYLTRLLENPDSILRAYSDAEIAQGFWLLIFAQYFHRLLDTEVPWSERRDCVRSIERLFEQLFAKRCAPCRARATDNPLDSVCFMWWDMFPTWGFDPLPVKTGEAVPKPEIEDRLALDAEILAVIKGILGMDSLACQESALHGLGLWQEEYPEFVQVTIDDFLRRRSEISPELREYAEAAREGHAC